jgi:hypothetical protein
MHTFLLESLNGKDHLGDLKGKIISKLTWKKQDVRVQKGVIWLRTGSMTGSCEHSNKTSASIKACMIISFSRMSGYVMYIILQMY